MAYPGKRFKRSEIDGASTTPTIEKTDLTDDLDSAAFGWGGFGGWGGGFGGWGGYGGWGRFGGWGGPWGYGGFW